MNRIVKLVNGSQKAIVVFVLLAISSLSACETIRPYQRVYIDDPDMNPRHADEYPLHFQRYREGASGGNASQASGGCGCN